MPINKSSDLVYTPTMVEGIIFEKRVTGSEDTDIIAFLKRTILLLMNGERTGL